MESDDKKGTTNRETVLVCDNSSTVMNKLHILVWYFFLNAMDLVIVSPLHKEKKPNSFLFFVFTFWLICDQIVDIPQNDNPCMQTR